MARSRVVCPKGYEMSRLGRLVSVTSCVNYCDFTNDAALLHIIAQTDRLRVDVPPRLLLAKNLADDYHHRAFSKRFLENF